MDKHRVDKVRILVVEDEVPITRISKLVLTGEGYTVEIANDGLSAQAILDKTDFDVIFMDVKMPGMTGIELFEWLKRVYPGKATRVVFTTGDVMSGNTQSFLDESARPFLPKPFTPVELRTMVKQALENKYSTNGNTNSNLIG
jgi:CheY-like chemotaxis protein